MGITVLLVGAGIVAGVLISPSKAPSHSNVIPSKEFAPTLEKAERPFSPIDRIFISSLPNDQSANSQENEAAQKLLKIRQLELNRRFIQLGIKEAEVQRLAKIAALRLREQKEAAQQEAAKNANLLAERQAALEESKRRQRERLQREREEFEESRRRERSRMRAEQEHREEQQRRELASQRERHSWHEKESKHQRILNLHAKHQKIATFKNQQHEARLKEEQRRQQDREEAENCQRESRGLYQ